MKIKKEILENNIKKVRENIEKSAIKSKRKPEEITLVAVTKTVPAEVIEILEEYNIKHIGENRVQSAREKFKILSPKAKNYTWHMIGHFQTNKINQALKIFDFYHSIDSIKLAENLNKRAGKKIPILLEVNISREKNKYGFKVEEIKEIYPKLIQYNKLDIQGLMGMAPFTDNLEICRRCFIELREILEYINEKYNANLYHLSMGMTQDYQVAIEEGATIVRIGTALFKNIF